MKKLLNNPDAIHVVINPRTGRKYALPRFVKSKSYSIADLIPVEKATVETCFTTQEIWDIIVKNAWSNGEPGILFEDEINRTNTTPHIGRIESPNPCGEQPLLPCEACILGSIDVSKFVNTGRIDLDWDKLAETTSLAVRFLDNMIDANHYPIPQIRETTLGNRRIGLGIMGFAYMLILLGIRYGCDKSIEMAAKIAEFIQKHAHKASELLAKERGCFPNWKGSLWDVKYHRPMRNATCTTIAPTGSISRIAGTSSSIEPLYSIVTKSLILDGQEFVQLDPLVERLGTEQGWLTDKVRELLIQGVPPREIPEIPQKLAEVLVTAHEVTPEEHVRIQAAFQQYTDNAVSKTVNLPADATVEDVDKIFRLAHQLGCKGITVYRDGCREHQVITAAHKNIEPSSNKIKPRPRTRRTKGETTKYTMGCGKLYVTVNKDEQGLCEVFANLGKAGGCPAQSEATCRIVSAALRSGVEPTVLIKQLKGIRCLSTVSRRKTNKDITVLSCPDAIARAIEEALGQNDNQTEISLINKCPDCSYPLRRESGCNVCDNCGYTKCG
jgi:ribonucleoside-diphosphate reductase alpha chain